MTEIHKEINQRIEELSDFLGVDDSKVTNASIIFGFYKYLLPYQKRRDSLHKESVYKKIDEIDELKNKIKSQIESDYDIIDNLKKFEEEFEERYQDKTFTTSIEWRNELLDYLETPVTQKIDPVEEIEEKKKDISIILRRKLVRKKPKKTKIKKERYEPPIKLLPKAKIWKYFFFLSVIMLILFMFIWTFFPELQFLHGYSVITVGVLLSLMGLGLVIHYRQVSNWIYFIHRHGLFFIFATLPPIIIFTLLRFSEVHIWIYNFTLGFFFLIIIPLCFIGFIGALYYHYFPSLAEWKDKRNVKKMTYRFIAENPYGTFKDPYERTKAFAGFIQDPNKVGDLLE